jgi:FAD/FMN-containing dehydrogenase
MSSLPGFKGRVVARGEPDYEATRLSMAWNALKPSRHRDIIVQPVDSADVVAAVNHAREAGMKIAIRSGGHRWGSPVLRDGGMLLDLGKFDTCEIDKARMTAKIGPAMRNDYLMRELGAQGLTFPTGHCSDVTVGGYLLNGGVGWNFGTYGIACMSVRSIEVVTAAGEPITASATENQDFYWAARGGASGFFGVVLSYTVAVYPAPKCLRMSMLGFPASQSAAVGAWMHEIAYKLPPGVEPFAFIQTSAPPLAGAASHIVTVGAVAFADSDAQAQEWLTLVRDCPVGDSLMATHCEETDFDKLYALTDQGLPRGARIDCEALALAGDAGAYFATAHELVAAAPSPRTYAMALFWPAPPPGAQMPDCAFSLSGDILIYGYSVWDDPVQDGAHAQWLVGFEKAFDGAIRSYYVGESRFDTGPRQSRLAYAAANWQKFCTLKRKHDPQGIFHWFPGGELAAGNAA